MDSNEVWTNILIPLLLGQLCLYIKSIYDNYVSHKNEQKKIKFDEELNNLRNLLQNLYWPVYIKLLCIYQLNYNIPIKNSYEYISSDSDSEIEFESNIDLQINKIPTKKCNHIYLKNDQRIHCKSRIPMNSNNICKKCRWRKEDKSTKSLNSNESTDSCESNIDKELQMEENTIEISIPIPVNDDTNGDINIDTNDINIDTNIIGEFELQTILIDKNTVMKMEQKLNSLYDEVLHILENNMCSIGCCDKINKTIILFIKYCKIRSIINDGSIKQKYNPNYFGVVNNTNKLLSIIEKKAIQYHKEYNNLLEKGPFN